MRVLHGWAVRGAAQCPVLRGRAAAARRPPTRARPRSTPRSTRGTSRAVARGVAINPLICEGQIQGGLAQGIGQALLEHVIYDRQSGCHLPRERSTDRLQWLSRSAEPRRPETSPAVVRQEARTASHRQPGSPAHQPVTLLGSWRPYPVIVEASVSCERRESRARRAEEERAEALFPLRATTK